MTNATATYQAAVLVHARSYKAHQAAIAAYRNREIDDATYLAARASHEEAGRVVEAAYDVAASA